MGLNNSNTPRRHGGGAVGACQYGARAPWAPDFVVSPRSHIEPWGDGGSLDGIDEPASEGDFAVYEWSRQRGQMAMLLNIFLRAAGGGARGKRPQSQVAPA
ncbi:MAG: hypothetical protein CM15mP25_3390 [Gammaproteobacteria bacterium]|nr:MAG: hypothetical protein CM15mP25_3390 [Gammaproteobacteria bacterium]